MLHYFQVSEEFMPMWGVSRFSKGNLLSHSTEKFRGGTFLCFKKFLLSKNIMDKRVGGGKEYHVNLSLFMSHSTKKFRRRTFPFHTIFLVSKYFMDKRWGVKEGGVSRCSFKNFLSSQSTEKLRREHFCVSLISFV